MRLSHAAILFGVMVLWGLNFVAAKFGFRDFEPIFLLSLRFLIMGLVLVPFVEMPRAKMGHVVGLSFTMGSLHFGLMFTGVAGVDAAFMLVPVADSSGREVSAGRRKVRRATARLVNVEAMAARRQAAHVRRDDDPMWRLGQRDRAHGGTVRRGHHSRGRRAYVQRRGRRILHLHRATGQEQQRSGHSGCGIASRLHQP